MGNVLVHSVLTILITYSRYELYSEFSHMLYDTDNCLSKTEKWPILG